MWGSSKGLVVRVDFAMVDELGSVAILLGFCVEIKQVRN